MKAGGNSSHTPLQVSDWRLPRAIREPNWEEMASYSEDTMHPLRPKRSAFRPGETEKKRCLLAARLDAGGLANHDAFLHRHIQ